jgi:hypothetical protein
LPINSTIYAVSVWVVPLVIAITFHEAAHGFVAHRLGDNTAWQLGRVSFNPLKHIDPFGTLLLPAFLLLSHSPFLFGYAKPVPAEQSEARYGLGGARRTRHQHRAGPGRGDGFSSAWLCACGQRAMDRR